MTIKSIIVLLFVFSISTIGCSQMSKKETETGMLPIPTPLSSGFNESENLSQSPMIIQESTKPNLKKDRFPLKVNPKNEKSIVLNDPLLDLSEKEFKRMYNKLPDDYEIEIGIENGLFLELTKSYMQKPFKWEKSFNGVLTKKQAQQIKIFTTFNNEDREVDIYSFNMKGLRYFPNIETVKLHNSSLCNLEELGYLSKLKRLWIDSSNLGIGKSTNKLKCISGMKEVNVGIWNCRLRNLYFLNAFPDLKNIRSLDFSDNRIKDISPLKRVVKVSGGIDLSNNKLSDIKSLSNIKEIGSLYLTDNKITDLSPISKLMKIDELWLKNNRIDSVKALSGLKKAGILDIWNNRVTDLSPLKNMNPIDINDFIFDFAGNCVLDYSPIETLLNKCYHLEKSKIEAGTFFYECMKWHYNMVIQGIEYIEDSDTLFTFFTTRGKYNTPLQDGIHPACNVLLFFNSIGGFGSYDAKDGILKCNYQGKTYTFQDFKKTVMINDTEEVMQYEMKHMQGDQPFAAVIDLCNLTGKSYQVKETRTMWLASGGETREIPSLVEVS
jgi:Leucine-rich repeat (LRR) protein